MSITKSPKYPNYALSKAIDNVRKVFDEDRTTPLPRDVIAKHLGYSGRNGASDGSIATVAQYGLLERVSKGEMKVSQLAVDILLPEDGESGVQKQEAINRAALTPPLFLDIWDHFEKRVPSDEALKTYLLRREFNDRAIEPIMNSFAPTMAMMKQQKESESDSIEDENHQASSASSNPDKPREEVNAAIGDYVQWVSQDALQFKEPLRVRWVSDDGNWLAVDDNKSGIPMNEVTIEQPQQKTPPQIPPVPPKSNLEVGFTEWFRVKVGAEKLVTINYKGEGDIGPREIAKMIAILEAQKLALED